MRKPKFFKKSLSFFLAFLMLLSSITVGFTAFAGTDKTWDLDSFVVDGTDIGKYLVEVARSFYDDAMAGGGINAEYGTADWRNYANLDVNGSPGGKARGTLIKDVTPEGNTYKAIKNAWEAIMRNTDVQNSDIPNKMRDYLKNALRDKMNPAGDYAASNAWEYCMESFFGYAHCTGKTSTSEHWVNGKSNTKSYNVVLTLSPEYYLWNAYGDDLANLPDNGVLPTHKCWWWINSNGSIVAAGKRANKGATKYDRDLFATYVRAKELKDFNTFIGEDFQTLKDGYNQYKSNGNSFNGMNQSDIAFSKLSQDRQIELLQKTIDNMNAIRNGTRQDTENGMPKTTLAHIVNDGADRAYPEVVIDGKKVEGAYIDISQADTDKVYKHFFGEYSDMENYVTALQQYMLMQFKNAVNAVKTNLYNDGDTSKGVNSDLTISELQDIKKNNIEFAEDIWVALPKALQDLLGTERTALNNYKADFIKLWNKRIGEAYISEVDELDKAVVGYPANFGQEGYIKLTDTGLRPAFVKSKLDAAADYRKQLLKADFTPTTVFGNAPGITGTTFLNDMNAAETNYNYVLEKYNRYLYEDFITAAKKIDPNAYTVQNGNPVAKDAGLDFFTKATANSRAKAALKKYKLLTNSYKNYDEAPFYFKVASLVWSIQGYEQYKMPAPTHMNWDDLGKANGSTKPITDLIERLSDFVSDPEMNQAVLGFKLNKRDLGNLLTEMGPDLVNGLMEFLYPFVKKALQDIVIDTELIGMKLKSTAYDMTVTGSFLSGPLGINISVKLSGLVPTPKLMGADSEMKNFSTNASVLSSYGENWEDVDWSKMDWKIGGTSADDSVYLTEVTTSLGNALAAALHGALKIVDAILKGQDAYLDVSAVGIDASNIDAVKKQTFVCKGSEGYETLVLPILEFLDCQGIVNTETFKGHDFKTSLNDILVPLVNKVADILENNTFDQIAKLLPNLAYVLEYGIINNMLHSIDASIAGQDGGRLDLGLWSNILKTDAIDSDFVNTKISELVPADLGLVIPEISFLQLGHLAAQIDTKSSIRTTNGGKRNWLNVPAEKALTWIVYYIDELLLENEDFFTDLVSANANISPDAKFDVMALILDLLGGTFDGLENASDFAADFYQLFTAYTPDKFNWVQTVNGWKWQKNTVDYSKVTDLYTKADVENFISQLNGILNNILPNLFKAEKGDTIRDFLNEQLY
ncbi:MAG: hypothetical protein K2I73_04275 [Eubacterium sp.]|nr:hypothetical protein [Eubacterium sp.]